MNQLAFEDFALPFGGKLRRDNPWVILAKQIPWAVVETAFAQQFSQENIGLPANSTRLALGALIVKECLGVTDCDLVVQSAENPYLQYFLGLMAYQEEAPFHYSLLTTFRKRLAHDSLGMINEALARQVADVHLTETTSGKEQGAGTASPGKGQLRVDAIRVPADNKFSTDIHLLTEAREKTEWLIDHMNAGRAVPTKKPRTDGQKARQAYLRVAKPKKPRNQKLRQGLDKQLQDLWRNLYTIVSMAHEGLLVNLSPKRNRQLLVIHELYPQQLWRYTHHFHRIADRVESIRQPHVRPIVQGKAWHPVEFGSSISVSLVDGISFVDRISWDVYNESLELVREIESYRQRFGHDLASVHLDQIYCTRENRRFCASKRIPLLWPHLGSPRKISETNVGLS